MTWKEFVKDYLSFTRKERIAILCLVVLILVIFFIPHLLSYRVVSQPVYLDSSLTESLSQIGQNNTQDNEESGEYINGKSRYTENNESTLQPTALFYFDPNTISENEWRRLGLRERTIRTIINYREKGGRFREQEDLQKIYGLKPEEYKRLYPFIRIAASNRQNTVTSDTAIRKPYRTTSNRVIDINTADTSAFIALPGIGSKLATRIVLFRERLGGFYSLEQLAETYGLPDSVFQRIRPFLTLTNHPLRKININLATIEELKSHPYVRTALAQPIVAYRNEHGKYVSLSDLKKVGVVTDEVFQKLLPYLELE